MTPAKIRHPWPGVIDWGGDWLTETQRELAHLGFVLRDGSAPGVTPGPRLLVALRDHPTLDHFDPEAVTYWVATDGHGSLATLARGGRLATLDRDGEATRAVPWSWGPVRVRDRVPVSNGFLGFRWDAAGRCRR